MKKILEMPLPKLILIITVILMCGLFIINMLVFNLSEYIEFFRNIHETFGKFVIISEIILVVVLVICIGLLRYNGYQYTFNIPLENASQKFNETYEVIHSKYNDNLKSMKGNLAILEIFTWFSYMLAIASFPMAGIWLPSLSIGNMLFEIWIYAIVLSFIGLPVVALSLRNGKKRDYIEYFKDNCIKEFLKEFNFEYFRIAPFGIDDKLKDIFNEVGCDSGKAVHVKVEDYITKLINDNKIELAEACCSGSFNGGNLVLFDGIFGYLKLNKDFNFRLRIKNSDLYECNDLRKMELKESKFTQCFSVYSDNEKLALEILTDEFVQLFVEIYEKYGIQFEININKDLLTIKFYTGKMFEPTIVGETFNKNAFFAYYSITEFAVELINMTKEYIDRL